MDKLTGQHASLLLLSSVCYINTFFGGFVFDDSEAIVKNKDVMPQAPLTDVFFNDFWGTEIALNLSHKSYRPLTILTYRFNVYLADYKLNAFHFHATNILLYMSTTLLVYYCLQQFVQKYLAYNASLLFSVHPVHTEVVASLVGRADLLCSIAFLFSMILYKYVLSFQHKKPYVALILYVVNVFVVFCGVLCKETAITALGMCFVLEFLHFITKQRMKTAAIIRCAGLIASCIAIMYFRLWVMAFEGPIFTKIDNAAAYSDNLFTKIFTYNYIYFLNILLLLWPQWLCFDWSMGCVPLIETPSDIRIIFVLIFWLSIAATPIVLLKQYKNKVLSNELLLGGALLVLPFVPASNLFLKVGFVIAERTLFLPSCGFCLLVAHGYQKLLKQKKRSLHVTKKHFYCLLVILAAKTILRNFEWLSEEALFTSALQVCPLNAKVHYNVAKVAADKHDKLLAVEGYQRALSLNPDYEQAMNNLANILREDKQFDEAERLLRRAVHVRPNFAAAWMNLGIVLATLNQTAEAEECYLKAISHRPKYPDCYYNLGNLYLDLRINDKALRAWEMAVHYRPTHTAAWSNTLVLLDSLNQYDEVLKRGRNALMHNPKAPALHFSIANTLGKLQEFEKAEKHFLEALNFNPHNALYYSNLGVLYHRWGNVDKAREMYKKALLIDPHMKTTESNLRKLLNANHSTSQPNNSESSEREKRN